MERLHEHEHEHAHPGPIRISRHEGALVGAVRGSISGLGFDEAEARLAAQAEEAARRVGTAGGVVGHIKFSLCEEGRCALVSVTDAGARSLVRRFPGSGCLVEGAAIVFALEEETLERILEETVGSLLQPED